jgi:hypothetical protein
MVDVATDRAVVLRDVRRLRVAGTMGLLDSDDRVRRSDGLLLGYQRRSGAPLFERNRTAKRVGLLGLAIVVPVTIASAVVALKGGGHWVFVASGAIWYLLIIVLGPIADRGVDAPTRPVT